MNQRNAFILRSNTAGGNWISEALDNKTIIMGWCEVPKLLEQTDWYSFRQIVHDYYYKDEKNFRRAGNAAGSLWKFLKEMKKDDYVVIPAPYNFYLAMVKEDKPYHDPSKVDEDRAFLRKVTWLNNKEPIPRKYARSSLQSRMKIYHTCGNADDLVHEIEEVLDIMEKGEKPNFYKSLRMRLLKETKEELITGYMEERDFEELIGAVLSSLGGENVDIVSRSVDKGVDIKCKFSIANTFKIEIGVQAKYFYPDPPVGSDRIEKFVEGLNTENIKYGWFVTSGTYSEEAIKKAEELQETHNCVLELIDGEQLSAMLIESGIKFSSVPKAI